MLAPELGRCSVSLCKVRTCCSLGIGYLRPRTPPEPPEPATRPLVLTLHSSSSPPSSFPFSTFVVKISRPSLKQSSRFLRRTAKLTTEELSDRPYRIGRRQEPESPSLHAVRALCCLRRPSRSPQMGKECRMYIESSVLLRTPLFYSALTHPLAIPDYSF